VILGLDRFCPKENTPAKDPPDHISLEKEILKLHHGG
jgi:hypothetical protein